MQLNKEEIKKFNTTIKCPLPKIIYSTLASLSSLNNQNNPNYNSNTITNYSVKQKPNANINTHYIAPGVNTKTNYKKSNMLPSLMVSSKFSTSGEISAKNRKFNKNDKFHKSQNFGNKFKDLLKNFGLNKYYEKMNELGINENTYTNLGLMTRKNINELINNLNIFSGHIIKFEKMYEYLRNETLNEENNNFKSNNKNNNNKNPINYVSLNFNYNDENNELNDELNNKIKNDHSHSLCKYKFINSSQRPHATNVKENFWESSMSKNARINKSVRAVRIKKLKKNIKNNNLSECKKNKINKIGLNNLLLKNFVKEKSNNNDPTCNFTYNSYIQNLINAYNNSQTEKSKTLDNLKGNKSENSELPKNYYINNSNAKTCAILPNGQLIPNPIVRENEQNLKLPNIPNKNDNIKKSKSKKTMKTDTRNFIKNGLIRNNSVDECNNKNENENIINEEKNLTNRTEKRNEIKNIIEKNNKDEIINAETFEEKPMLKFRGKKETKNENINNIKNNDNINNNKNIKNDNINENPSINTIDKNINTIDENPNSNTYINKCPLEDLIFESCRVNRSFSENIQQDIIQFDTENICRSLSFAILLLIESSEDKQHITELSSAKFKFLKQEYNSNINIIFDLFNEENNSKMLTQTQISNLDKLNNILNKNDPVNEDINILKHIKKIKDEELIKKEDEKNNGSNLNEAKENHKFRSSIGEIERDLKFIDEFFTPNKKKVINYQYVSEASKNVLCKELSYINELDSELNKTNSVLNNENNSKSVLNNVSEINLSQKEFNSPIKIGIDDNLNINNEEYKETIQNAEDDISNGNEGDMNELNIITECIGGDENKDNNNINDDNLNIDNEINNNAINDKNNNENNNLTNNINNKIIENNTNIKKEDPPVKESPNNDNNISNQEKNKNNNIEKNPDVLDENLKNNSLSHPNINQKINLKEFSTNTTNTIPSPNIKKNNEHEDLEIIESDYIIDIDTVEKLKTYFLKQSEIFDDNYNYNLMQIINRKYIIAPDPQTIFDFCADILVLTKMEKEVLILSLIYIERFIFNTGILLTSRNWRRILFIALIISSKIWDDNSFENTHFAQIFNSLKLGEINLLEEIFLNFINYKVFVTQKEYFEYLLMIKNLVLKYSYNGRNIIPISVEESLRLQSYTEEMQNRMRRKVTLNNSAQF